MKIFIIYIWNNFVEFINELFKLEIYESIFFLLYMFWFVLVVCIDVVVFLFSFCGE